MYKRLETYKSKQIDFKTNRTNTLTLIQMTITRLLVQEYLRNVHHYRAFQIKENKKKIKV